MRVTLHCTYGAVAVPASQVGWCTHRESHSPTVATTLVEDFLSHLFLKDTKKDTFLKIRKSLFGGAKRSSFMNLSRYVISPTVQTNPDGINNKDGTMVRRGGVV